MAKIIPHDELLQAVKEQSFIKAGSPECAEGIKYDFRLSHNILKARFSRPVDASRLTSSEQSELVIEPGEVVFVLSEETLDLPNNMFVQLSPKRKLSQAGVQTLGGFAVDPGYQGKLLVGLLNYASTDFILRPLKKLIGATFYLLEKGETPAEAVPTRALTEFPDELVDVMKKYRPIGSRELKADIKSLKREIAEVSSHLREQENWRKVLDHHDRQIGQLIDGLNAEKEARIKGEDKLSQAIDALNKNFAVLEKNFTLIKGGALVIGAILAIIASPIVVNFISSFL